jgi:hypothetical protein
MAITVAALVGFALGFLGATGLAMWAVGGHNIRLPW